MDKRGRQRGQSYSEQEKTAGCRELSSFLLWKYMAYKKKLTICLDKCNKLFLWDALYALFIQFCFYLSDSVEVCSYLSINSSLLISIYLASWLTINQFCSYLSTKFCSYLYLSIQVCTYQSINWRLFISMCQLKFVHIYLAIELCSYLSIEVHLYWSLFISVRCFFISIYLSIEVCSYLSFYPSLFISTTVC